MRHFRALPEAFSLRKVRWQLFATLTFHRDGMPEHVRKSMLRAWLRKLCRAHCTYFPDLLFCWRYEYGASHGIHGHYHMVVAGLPSAAVTEATCRQAEALWERRGGGFAQVEIYNPSLDGVGYLLKIPIVPTVRPVQDEDYYFPTLSEAVFRVMRTHPN